MRLPMSGVPAALNVQLPTFNFQRSKTFVLPHGLHFQSHRQSSAAAAASAQQGGCAEKGELRRAGLGDRESD